MGFFLLSRQQKQETPQAMIIMRQTLTAPTIRSSLRLIWQFLPANQGLQLQVTSVLSRTHWPFLMHRRHDSCDSFPDGLVTAYLLQSSHSVLAPEQSLPGSCEAGVMSRYPRDYVS